jgi:hypothetical protein
MAAHSNRPLATVETDVEDIRRSRLGLDESDDKPVLLTNSHTVQSFFCAPEEFSTPHNFIVGDNVTVSINVGDSPSISDASLVTGDC